MAALYCYYNNYFFQIKKIIIFLFFYFFGFVCVFFESVSFCWGLVIN